MFKFLALALTFLMVFFSVVNGQENTMSSPPLQAAYDHHEEGLKPVVIGAVTQQPEDFFVVVSFFEKQKGIFVQHFCSTEKLIEMVYDESLHGDLKTYLEWANKQLPFVRFYIKPYQPIEKISSCQDVVKNNF